MERKRAPVLLQFAGESIIDVPSCFDQNNKYLFCASETYLHQYCVLTRSLVRRFNHSSKVVSIHCFDDTSKDDDLKVVTCCVNKQLSIWRPKSGKCVAKICLEVPGHLLWIEILIRKPNENLFFMSRSLQGPSELLNANFSISHFSDSIYPNKILSNVPIDRRQIDFGNGFVVFTRGKAICLHKFADRKSYNHNLMSRKFVSVACHFESDSVAAGDNTGRILIWGSVLESFEDPSQIIHWQSLPVRDMVWSPEGSSIISGGKERVLVKYTLHRQGKWTRLFLPRLPTAICKVSVSADGYCIAASLEDNSIQLVSNQMKVMGEISGFVHSLSDTTVGLHCDLKGVAGPESVGALWTNGRYGQLQCYSTVERALLLSVDVTGLNLPPGERLSEAKPVDVSFMALTAEWLATVETSSDPILCDEQLLKFWKFNLQDEKFECQSQCCIEEPHCNKVTCICFSADQEGPPRLLSSGLDSHFRLWCIRNSSYNNGVYWYCCLAKSYQGLEAHCCAFSDDGSVFAVGFEMVLTLWKYCVGELISAENLALYSYMDCDEKIRQIIWGREDTEHLVACRSDTGILIFDTESLSPMWKLNGHSTVLTLDPTTGFLAAVGKEGDYPADFLLLIGDDGKLSAGVQSAAFVPSVQRDTSEHGILMSELYILTSDKRLVVCCTNKQLEHETSLEQQYQVKPKTSFVKYLERFRSNNIKSLTATEAKYLDQKGNIKQKSSAAREQHAPLTHTLDGRLPFNPKWTLEEAINTESGQQDASTILSENGDLTKEGGHANNGQENDLCHQCWLRELHLAAAEKQQADQLIREKSGEAAILNHCNQHEGAWDYQDTDKKALESRKQREKEIKEYNFKMAREKQENEKTDHKTFLEESPRKIQEVESANTGYLMYKRPDTASYAKSNKTKQQLHREELERQVKLKQDLENKDRNEDLQNSSRLNYNSQQEVNAEKSKLKQRNQRNKIEYRKALETQIAAKNVGSNFETGEREIGWSDRESENREKVDFQTDQSKRHARQEKAAKDLEAFKMRQKETDVAERERRMQVSAFMREEQQNFPEEEAKTVSQKESKLERQRQVESAWQKAEEETNQKFDILRNQHGGSLLDQLKQYRRCRKCQKAIVDKQQPGNGKKEESWEEMNRDLLRPLDQDDLHIDHGHKHKHENNNKQLKSRHL